MIGPMHYGRLLALFSLFATLSARPHVLITHCAGIHPYTRWCPGLGPDYAFWFQSCNSFHNRSRGKIAVCSHWTSRDLPSPLLTTNEMLYATPRAFSFIQFDSSVFGYLKHPVPYSFVVRWSCEVVRRLWGGCEVVRLWGCEVVRLWGLLKIVKHTSGIWWKRMVLTQYPSFSCFWKVTSSKAN